MQELVPGGAAARSGGAEPGQRTGEAPLSDEILEMITAATAAGTGLGRVSDGLDGIGATVNSGDDLVVGHGVADTRKHGLASSSPLAGEPVFFRRAGSLVRLT